MSVIVLCPTCREPATFHRSPVTLCAHCQRPYPDAVRAPAERALAQASAGKPLFLVIGQLMSACMAVTFLALPFLALFDAGTFTLNEEPVSGPEFIRAGGLAFGVVGLLFAAIAFGLWRDRPWARPLIMLFWPALIVIVIALSWDTPDAVAQAVGILASAGPLALIAWWYLYRKTNVTAYFAAHEPPASIPERAA